MTLQPLLLRTSPRNLGLILESSEMSPHESPPTTPALSPLTKRRLSRRRSSSLNDLASPCPDSISTEPVTDVHSAFSEFLKEVQLDEANFCAESRRLAFSGLNDGSDELSTKINHFVDYLFKCREREARLRSKKSRKPTRSYGQVFTGRNQKAANYKKCQDLFQKARRTLADKIIGGQNLASEDKFPKIQDVEQLFGNLLESQDHSVDETTPRLATSINIFVPITPEEIQKAKTSWHPSAPGVDGIKVETVRTTNNNALSVLYSVILFRNTLPTSWRNSRTTLVPKDGDLSNPNNWRPITISSACQRLFHRVLTARIKENVQFNQHQRGFLAVDGTLANTMILDHYIRSRTEQSRQYCVLSLDIRKAFDSVSHGAIARAMLCHGIPEGFTNYVMNTITDSTTTIRVGQSTTRPIQIRRGVKQGDPLSPFLFNMVMDELLHELNKDNKGATIGPDIHCTAMAFADDIVLLCDNEELVPGILDQVTNFFRRKGMRLNPQKSKCISGCIVDKKLVPRQKPIFKINGVWIPMVSLCDHFRFLGHEFNASGVMRPGLPNLPLWLSNIHRAPLKPDQKLIVLREYMIPRLLYGLQNPKITATKLREADRLIRGAVKKMLHLHVHVADASIHARVRDGGLGIMELKTAIPRIFLGRLASMLEFSEDSVLNYVLQTTYARTLMDRLSNQAGDIPAQQVWRERIATGPFTKGTELANEDPASRSWIYNKPNGWTGRDYVRAIQLRAASLPSKGIPSNPPDQRRCRAGCEVDETTCHILQKCPRSHGLRVRRHNEIVHKISRHCKKSWLVEEEPHVRHDDGQLYKPDLVVHQPDNKTIVVDVQVSWEGSTPLDEVWDRKRVVYDNSKFLEAARKRWPGKKFTFSPIILGARGIWPRANELSVNLLAIPPYLRQSCVHSTLKWASSIHNGFMTSIWE